MVKVVLSSSTKVAKGVRKLFGALGGSKQNTGIQRRDIEVDGFVFTITLRNGGNGATDSAFIHGTFPKGNTPEQVAALYAVEELILEHALAGIDVSSAEYRAGISAALKRLPKKFGSYIPKKGNES